MTSTIPDIHIIDGNYYNYNGKNPDVALSKPYGKRLYRNQVKYGGLLTTKESSGHGELKEKSDDLLKIVAKENKKQVKKSVKNLNKIQSKELLDDIKHKRINVKNLRTRFRSGFRVYHKDDEGNVLDTYDVISFAKATNGLIPLERFLNELPNEAFQDNVRGGFKYVVYDVNTKEVHHSFEYGEQD